MNQLNNIGIIGLGLIGGSIAKALKKNISHVAIGSLHRDCLDLRGAMEQKMVDRVFKHWEELLTWCDLIILASPLSTLSKLAVEIKRWCPQNKTLLVIDVGSVKKAVFPAFEMLTDERIEFLSTHPMAGKERWGFAHSDANLFQDCAWILSPHSKNQCNSLSKISALIQRLGARPVVLSPQKHDEQIALISHLPALISRLLLKFVETKNPEALHIAGPGFKSMTRLARDNPHLQSEISALNNEELMKQFREWLSFISQEEGS